MNSVRYMQQLQQTNANAANSNSSMPAGGVVSAANLHPAYQQRLNGNASGVNLPASQFNTRHEGPPVSRPNTNFPVRRVFNPAEVITRDQQQYYKTNQNYSGNPTLFEHQNAKLKIGGSPLWKVHRDKLPPHPTAVDTSFTLPLTPQEPLGNIYRNPGPFDHAAAVRSSHPTAYTHPDENVRRMMRDVSEVDPELVTNPISDPTFMARMPVFNHATEQAETDRIRSQRTSGAMRFW